ncbi:BZ3500_MvSof-1268-A1-R1_Chr5-3g08338 [Microbotryum saponariae]|uniref:BZ3500_MvSof-1268-A1-R1_Chr5-3g08338 protein n=1 Tax=Microbotryum saponariae TaxID=289078 RepID=A0A2X0NQC9_9BASI|nr:BZ3500_MvSof-1268-A1-R1_Chr5-3g08338 [Microbotryum saponariae]SDA08446.1 BZ3501_MvSof-1269-A2-R1_Chr5-3g08066 [Microbotryum saponariae]
MSLHRDRRTSRSQASSPLTPPSPTATGTGPLLLRLRSSGHRSPRTDPNVVLDRRDFLRHQPTDDMGLQHREYLTSDVKVFGCRTCKTHLSIHEHIESKNFNGQHGRAYLFTTVYNINAGPPEDRPMTTGLHTVRDISCAKCGDVLGWKYGTSSLPLLPPPPPPPLLATEPKLTSLFPASSVDKAYDASQKYKEGKFILERTLTGE